MHLTWRDGVATVLAVLGGAVALAVLNGWDWALLGSYRAGIAVLGVIGLAMCGIGGYRFWNIAAAQPGSIAKDGFFGLGTILGLATMVVLVVGLVTGTRAPFVWMVVLMAALWVLATVRHAVEQLTRGAHAIGARVVGGGG